MSQVADELLLHPFLLFLQENATKRLLEQEKKQNEVSEVLQEDFNELSKMMETSSTERYKLHDDNVMMTKKIQFLLANSMETEKQVALVKQEAQLQKELYASDLAKIKLEENMEIVRWEHDCKVLELNLKISKEMCTQLQEDVKVLQEQTNFYVKKCELYENAMKKSNDMSDENYQAVETEKIVDLNNDAELSSLVDDLKRFKL